RLRLPGAAAVRPACPHPVVHAGRPTVLHGGARRAPALPGHSERSHRGLPRAGGAVGLAVGPHRVSGTQPRPGPGHRAAGAASGRGRGGAAHGVGAQRAARPLRGRVDRLRAAVHPRRGSGRASVRGHAVPGDERGRRAARHGPALRGGCGHARGEPVDRVPPGDAAHGGAGDSRRRGPVLVAGARRIRGDHHVRGKLPRPHPDDAACGVLGDAAQSGGGGRAQPGAARRLRSHPRRAAGPLAGGTVTAPVPVVDAHLVVHHPGCTVETRFQVASGHVLALLGPNGAGKSTVLRALAGLLPAQGHLRVDGVDLLSVPAERRPVGFVFQDFLLFPHLTVVENVAFGPRCQGMPARQARRLALDLLTDMGVAEYARARPRTLSGGQQQRVALARALATRPRLLLLDEPMAALDADTRMSVRAMLRCRLTAFSGATVLVTHDPLDAMVLADRVLVLEDGVSVQEGTPGDVARRPRTDYVARLVGVNLYRGRAAGTRVQLAGPHGSAVALTVASPHDGEVFAAFPP